MLEHVNSLITLPFSWHKEVKKTKYLDWCHLAVQGDSKCEIYKLDTLLDTRSTTMQAVVDQDMLKGQAAQ